jgi:prevent-host-death family protein
VKVLNISEAKAQLSAVVKQIEEGGEEVVLARAGRPVAKVVRYEAPPINRRLGLFKGQIEVAPDFDEWPDDLAEAFGIKKCR